MVIVLWMGVVSGDDFFQWCGWWELVIIVFMGGVSGEW